MRAEESQYPEHIQAAAFEWRVLIESGSASAEERAAFNAWCAADPRHADAYDRATTVWAALGTLDKTELDATFFEKSWTVRLADFVAGLGPVLQKPGFRTPVLAAAVAVLVLGMGLQIGLQYWPFGHVSEPSKTTYVTDVGEVRTVTLADGTMATLGAATELEIAMSSSERRINVNWGAALFDVVKDSERPFRVQAGSFTATALGTVFDIRNNGGIVRLSVSEGIVEATHPFTVNNSPTSLLERRELHAGQQVAATVQDGISPVESFQADSFGAWRDGRLMYVGATLRELVADANRYSDRPIQIEENANELKEFKVTVSFDGRDIDGMLATFSKMFPVDVDRNSQDAIVIRAR